MLNFLSIKQRIVLLALLPVLLLAVILSLMALSQANNVARLGSERLSQSLFEERRAQLDALLEIAITAINAVSAEEDKKHVLRRIRYENDSNYFFVYDRTGVQVVSADNPQREGQNFFDSRTPDGRYLVREYLEAARKGGGYVEYNWPRPGSQQAAPKLAKAINVPGTDWIIATGFYIDDLDSKIVRLNADTQAEVHAGAWRTLLIASLVVAAMLLFGLVLASTIVKPLQRAVSAMQDVASGDGDLTRRLDAGQGHELGALAVAFNNFAAKVAELVNNVRGSVNTLSQSASELSTLMQQAEQGVQQQHAESDQVATAMTEMSTTAQDVAGSASNAAHAANDAEQQVNRAASTLDAAIGVINGLEQQVNVGVEVISRVGSESQGIGGVIEVIRSIAEQTNLLALNAAIEAARAGDQGRGFAVVADEVRTLAARTASSTEEINQMIVRLQGGATEAVGAIDQIKQHSQHTVQEAEKVDRALREIQTAVSTINDMNNQIASAAEEQTTVAETINQNIHQIVIIAQDTANGTSRAASISRQLDQLASELDSIVGRYRT